MGQLVGSYVEQIYGDDRGDDSNNSNKPVPRFSMRFRISGEEGLYEERKRTFKALVEERNHLVHHFLERWDRKSIGSTQDAILFLTNQRARIVAAIGELTGVFKTITQSKQKLGEYFVSDQHDIDLLRHSPIPVLLGQFAQAHGNSSGWLSLSHAGGLLDKHAHDDMAELKKRYGVGKLKALMVKTGLFEFFDKPTASGVQVMYRVNPRWQLTLESK